MFWQSKLDERNISADMASYLAASLGAKYATNRLFITNNSEKVIFAVRMRG